MKKPFSLEEIVNAVLKARELCREERQETARLAVMESKNQGKSAYSPPGISHLPAAPPDDRIGCPFPLGLSRYPAEPA
ncbi:hypothetical protein ACFSQ7_39200 [Paenibacillus rhizoplanae]